MFQASIGGKRAVQLQVDIKDGESSIRISFTDQLKDALTRLPQMSNKQVPDAPSRLG